jgi:hypothetical protein
MKRHMATVIASAMKRLMAAVLSRRDGKATGYGLLAWR